MAVVAAYNVVAGEIRNQQNRLIQKSGFNDRYYLFYVDTSGATDYIYYKQSTSLSGLSAASATQLSTASISDLSIGKVDVAFDGSAVGVAYVEKSGITLRISFIGATLTAGGSITVDNEYNISSFVTSGPRNPQIFRNSNDRWIIPYFGRFSTHDCYIAEVTSPTSSTDWTTVQLDATGGTMFGAVENPADADEIYYFSSFGFGTNNIKFKVVDIPTYSVTGGINDSGYAVTNRNYTRPVVLGSDIYVCYRDGSDDLRYAQYNGSTWSNGAIDVTGTTNVGTTAALTKNGSGLYLYATVFSAGDGRYDMRYYTSSNGTSWTNETSELTGDFEDISSPNNTPLSSQDNSEGLVAWNNGGNVWVGSVINNLDDPLYAQNVMVFDSFVSPWQYNTLRHICHYWNQETDDYPK